MRYHELVVAPALRDLVACCWLLERDYGAGATGETVWPDGKIELLFQYGDRYRVGRPNAAPLGHGVVLGPLTRRLVLASPGRVRVVGVRFRPGGLAGLLGIPVDELTDQVVSAEALWGADGRRLVEQLGDANDAEAVRALEAFLLGSRRGPAAPGLDPIATFARAILARPETVREGLLRSRSRRQVERRFKRVVGLSPKRLAVIARFDSVRRHLLAHPLDNLSDVACRFGYFDYAHLSRDFARFLGVSPHAFRLTAAAGRPGGEGDVVFVHDRERPAPAAWAP